MDIKHIKQKISYTPASVKCCVYVNGEVEPQAKERNYVDCLLDLENVEVGNSDSPASPE